MDRTCRIEWCSSPNYGHGWCRDHWRRWSRTGDPLTPYKRPPGVKRLCSVEGCDNPHDARGHCAPHYNRWRAYGDPLGAPEAKPTTCAVEDCERAPAARGWCHRHWKRWRTHGDPLYVFVPEQRVCTVDGCTDRCYGQGWCRSHWAKNRRRRQCSLEGCEKPVVGRDMCSKHWTAWRRHGDPLWVAPVVLCEVEDCDRPNNSYGLCSLHARRKRKYGDPHARRRGHPNRHEPIDEHNARLVMTKPDGTVKVSLYSLADHEVVAAHHWYVNAQGYVVTRVGGRGTPRTVRLNRVLVGLADDDPRRADHEDGDTLNNRRENLRILTHQHNVAHQAIVNHRGASKYRNVHRASKGRWSAAVRISGHTYYVGTYATEEAAAAAVARFRQENGLPAGY